MAEFIISLAIALVVVTLVGHGIWVVLAAMIRAVRDDSGSATAARDCPACGRRKAVIAGGCRNCGATPFIRPAADLAPHDEVLVTMRRLKKLLERGAIKREDFDKLEVLIRADDQSPFATPSQTQTSADTATSTRIAPSDAPPAESSESDATTVSSPGTNPVASVAPKIDSETVDESIFDAEIIEDEAAVPPAVSRPPTAVPPSHPLDRPETPPPARRALAPRRTLAALLQAFMEEKNIRWGEIISGLLIVVCAVGLVVSLWATLRDSIPYLPALIFLVGTGAFHAAGHYTLRSWDLSSISRAVLIIATLLIPLNFLAAIALSGKADEQPAWTDPTYLAAIIVGLSAYGTMTFFAGRAFLGTDWWRLLAGVMGPCAGQLLINRFAHQSDSLTKVMGLAMIPLAGFLVATVSGLTRARRWKGLSMRRAEVLLLVLGIATFALLSALALLVAKSGAIWNMLAQLSPALSLVAGTVLASGLLIHQRTNSAKLYALRTTGTSLAIGAAFGLAICIVFAWPEPELLITVGTLNAILLAYMGFLVGLPTLHGFAVACGALAWIVAFHHLSGAYQSQTRWGLEIVRSFFTGQSAAALGVFAALMGGFALALVRVKHERDARGYFLGAATILAISGLLAIVVGFCGFPSSYLSPPTLCIYAIALSITARVIGDGRVAWVGSAILLVALVQAFGFVDFYHDVLALRGVSFHRAVMFAFLTHGVICLLVGACAGRLDAWTETLDVTSRRWSGFVRPLTESALATSLLAAPSALFVVDFHFGFHTIYLAVIAVIWLGVAVVRRWSMAFVVAHLAATLSLVTLVAALHHVDSWRDIFDPLHVAGTLLVLSTSCILAVLGRRFCRRWPSVERLLEFRDWPTVDRVTVGVVIATLLCVIVAGCVPGVLRELGLGKLAAELTMPGHHQAFEAWMWAAWAAVTAAIAFCIWERITRLCFESFVLACSAVPLLIAGPHEVHVASLSAIRWSLAIFGLAAATCWFARRSIFALARRRTDWPGLQDPGAQQMSTIPMLLVVLSAFPVLIATTMTVVQVVSGVQVGGPEANSFFAKIGAAWSYGTPLALVATMLLVIAVRDARASYALGGSVVFQYLASLACLLPALTATPGKQLGGIELARLGQWNAVALGSYGLIWLALRNWIEPDASAERPDSSAADSRQLDLQRLISVDAQVAAAMAAVALLAIAAASGIIYSPEQIHPAYRQLGRWSSFLALVLAVLGAVWLRRGRLGDQAAHVVCGAGFCLTALVAAATVPQNVSANWLSFHVLLVGWTLVVASAAAESWWPQRNSHSAPLFDGRSANAWILIGWGCTVGAIVAALALYAAVEDPTGPWWAFGATVTIALAAGAAALRVRSQLLAYASTLLATVAATYVWVGTIDTSLADSSEMLLLAHWLIITMAVGAGFWLAIEVNSQQRHDQPFQPDSNWLPTHRCFAAIALVGLLATTLLGAAIGALQRGPSTRQVVDVSTLWGLVAMAVTGALLVALLWDRRSRAAILSLYAWGLAAQAMIIDAFQWQVDNMALAVGISISAYIALTGALWRRGANLSAIGVRLQISDPVAGLRRTSNWLPPLTILGGGFALLLGLVLVLAHPDRPQRVLTSPIPVLIAIGLGCLAQSARKQAFQFAALVMLGLSCVFLSWADIPPGLDGPLWLSRVIRLLIVCCAVSFSYTMIVARRRDLSPEWQMSLKRVGLSAAACGLLVLASVLLLEAFLYLGNPTLGAPISDIQLAAVSVVMVGLVAALIVMAVLPGRDPLDLPEQGRSGYVYAAQLAGGLLFAHIYLTRPQWFGQWGEFWPYIILLIAFAGAGVGELFQRTGIRVLAEPLQRTGTFLPLLPAIGMWFVASRSDYSLYLFGAGILYMGLSIGRKSLASALAAGVAANGALWSLLDDRGLALFSQPQLWLIPPALSVLIAAEINRDRLPESTMTTLRYVGMMVIYLSSAGEIFIRGIGQALWPPMVLLGLSLLGAMAGIVLRIRAFLYLGVTFVLLSMISMVWHAARSINHVWPWWAFGIGLGVCILVFFGFFEKNRDKVTALVERLKEWKP